MAAARVQGKRLAEYAASSPANRGAPPAWDVAVARATAESPPRRGACGQTSDWPVISAGCAKPSSASTVGAMSHSAPVRPVV